MPKFGEEGPPTFEDKQRNSISPLNGAQTSKSKTKREFNFATGVNGVYDGTDTLGGNSDIIVENLDEYSK